MPVYLSWATTYSGVNLHHHNHHSHFHQHHHHHLQHLHLTFLQTPEEWGEGGTPVSWCEMSPWCLYITAGPLRTPGWTCTTITTTLTFINITSITIIFILPLHKLLRSEAKGEPLFPDARCLHDACVSQLSHDVLRGELIGQLVRVGLDTTDEVWRGPFHLNHQLSKGIL